jgi:two-component system NarL family sensor kinase
MPNLSHDIIAIILGTLFTLLIISFIIIFIVIYQKRHQGFLKEKEDLQTGFQQILLQSQLEIQEQTLQTISQEIHDNIGQVLSLAKLNLGTMDIAKPEQLQQKIDDSKGLIGKAIQDLRDISKSLNTDYVSEMGLTQAIGYELELIRKSGEFTTSLQTNGLPIKLDARKELIIFRIIQEVINNIIKHARANSILVLLTYEPHAFSISINDNGSGFDLTPLNAGENSKFGLGIRNMHKRANLIGADFSIASTLGAGTTVTLVLPLTAGTSGNG